MIGAAIIFVDSLVAASPAAIGAALRLPLDCDPSTRMTGGVAAAWMVVAGDEDSSACDPHAVRPRTATAAT